MTSEKQFHDLELIRQLQEIEEPNLARAIVSEPEKLDPFLAEGGTYQEWARVQVNIDPQMLEQNAELILDTMLNDVEEQLRLGEPLKAFRRLVDGIRRWFTSAVDNHLSLGPMMDRIERVRQVAGKTATAIGASGYTVEINISLPPGIAIGFHFDAVTTPA